MFMYTLHVKETQKYMRHAMIPKYILIPNLGFLPQIIYRYALGSTLLALKPMRGSRGGAGGPDPPEYSQKNIGFLSNTGPDPLKNHKTTKLAFNVGP